MCPYDRSFQTVALLEVRDEEKRMRGQEEEAWGRLVFD